MAAKKEEITIFFTKPKFDYERDYLGFSKFVTEKRDNILPGIKTTTSRFPYYIFCSIYDYFESKGSENIIDLSYSLDRILLQHYHKKSKNNNNDENLRHLIGKSKIKDGKIKKDNWVKLNSRNKYYGSYKELFKNKGINLLDIILGKNYEKQISKLCKDNKCKTLNKNDQQLIERILDKFDRKKKEIHKMFLGKNEKLNTFYNFYKKTRNKEPDEFIDDLFCKKKFISSKNNNNKFKELIKELKEMIILEKFLWAYELLFVANLLNENTSTKGENNNNEEEKYEIKDWPEEVNQRLNPNKSNTDESNGKLNINESNTDESKGKKGGSLNYNYIKKRTEKYLRYLRKIKENKNIFVRIKNKCGDWVELENGYENQMFEYHIYLHNNDIISKKNIENNIEYKVKNKVKNGVKIYPFPRHFYGIYNFLSIMNDLSCFIQK